MSSNMSLRPGKAASGASAAAGSSGKVAEAASPSTSQHDPLYDIAGPLPPKEERIYLDNSNLSEIKTACDDAVERILTRPAIALAPAPAASPLALTPTTSNTDGQVSPMDGNGETDHAEGFPPFKASHFHVDLRLLLGYLAVVDIVSLSLWAYFVEKEWQKNKKMTAFAVAIYVALSCLQALDAYVQGDKIFIGKRKTLSKRIETEHLTISSPPLGKSTLSTSLNPSTNKPYSLPPHYLLKTSYSRRSNKGKSLLRQCSADIDLGGVDEWITEEGEFVEAIFEDRLLSQLRQSWHGDAKEQ